MASAISNSNNFKPTTKFSLPRYVIVLLGALAVSACSSGRGTGPGAIEKLQCQVRPSSCMYEGRYEPGEREYAEREAARLNQASLERLRRRGGG